MKGKVKRMRERFKLWRIRKKVRKAVEIVYYIDQTLIGLGYNRKYRKTLWRDFICTSDKGAFIKNLIGDKEL